jgi:putative colanic acid biosynthesis acetyltransferase WcaF
MSEERINSDGQLIDVAANRRAKKWSTYDQVRRVLWAVAKPLFRFSPRPIWGWRNLLLRLFGAKIGKNVHIYPSVNIILPWNIEIGDYSALGDRVIVYPLGSIKIGENVAVSQGAHLCAGTHDWRDPSMPLVKSKIVIESNAWICADAFIGPDVRVGSYTIVGARAVVMKDTGRDLIVAGNPAKIIRRRKQRPVES